MHTQYKKGSEQGFSTIVLTVVISVLITLTAVAIALTYFGTQTVAEEVSPFVEGAQERLIEGIVPPAQRTEPKTDGDLILEAIASNRSSSLLLYRSAVDPANFVGRGILVSTSGLVITDEVVLQAGQEYVAVAPGRREPLSVTELTRQDGLVVLQVPLTSTQVARFDDVVPETSLLAAAINGEAEVQIATGIVTGSTGTSTVTTNIVGTMVPGVPLVSKEGYVIGIATADSYNPDANTYKILTRSYINSLTMTVDGI